MPFKYGMTAINRILSLGSHCALRNNNTERNDVSPVLILHWGKHEVDTKEAVQAAAECERHASDAERLGILRCHVKT